MLLSEPLLEQITSSLNGPSRAAVSPAALPADQRREPRVAVGADVTIIPLNDRLQTPSFEVSLRDVSAGGIGFVHSSKMALDEQFVVLLPAGGEPVAVLCQVAYYQPLAERVCSIGARFVRILRQPSPPPADAPIPMPVPPPPRRVAS